MTTATKDVDAGAETRKRTKIAPFLVDLAEAARLLGLSARHLAKLADLGLAPRGIYLGKARRFSVERLRAWCACDCPPLGPPPKKQEDKVEEGA